MKVLWSILGPLGCWIGYMEQTRGSGRRKRLSDCNWIRLWAGSSSFQSQNFVLSVCEENLRSISGQNEKHLNLQFSLLWLLSPVSDLGENLPGDNIFSLAFRHHIVCWLGSLWEDEKPPRDANWLRFYVFILLVISPRIFRSVTFSLVYRCYGVYLDRFLAAQPKVLLH